MWIIQKDSLLQLPDDVPLPPDSRVVEVPDEFRRNARDFRLEKGALVHAPRPTAAEVPRLTAEEIVQIKEALRSGLFKAVAETPDRRQPRRNTKEEPK